MSRTLTNREKRLLALCLGVLFFMATALIANEFIKSRTQALSKTAALDTQKRENQVWLSDQAFWEKRKIWLNEHMPKTDSLGRSQGQLLEELQNEALDRQIKILRQTLLEPVKTPSYQEVAVSVNLRGDQTVVMEWLATMQSPEKFQAIKTLEIELDSRAKEATPQAMCNLTLARWFKPEGAL